MRVAGAFGVPLETLTTHASYIGSIERRLNDEHPPAGTLVPGFVSIRRLALGATSVVYLARATQAFPYAAIGDQVAVKLFLREPNTKEAVKFDRELSVGTHVRSANLVRYLAAGRVSGPAGDTLYIVVRSLNSDAVFL
jgi:serine/threonine protein kinase